jgi:hypothetical protein
MILLIMLLRAPITSPAAVLAGAAVTVITAAPQERPTSVLKAILFWQ